MRRVLFVDDERNILQGLRRSIYPMRSEIAAEFASSGREALEKMKSEVFDVIVCDMRMPEMSGADVLADVRDRYPNTIRFILSGHSDPKDTLRAASVAHQFLAKPCDPETIRNAISGAVALRESVANEHAQRIASSISEFPSLPSVFVELQAELQNEEPSIRVIAEIVSSDPSLVAGTLKLVNSSFYGLASPTDSIERAVSYLGITTIRDIVMGASLFNPSNYRSRAQKQTAERLGGRARTISRAVRDMTTADNRKDSAHLAGMVSGVGVLACTQSSLLEDGAISDRDSIVEINRFIRSAYGAGADDIGAYLLGTWGFPDPIVEAVMFQDDPGKMGGKCAELVATLHIATHVHDALTAGEDATEWVARSELEADGWGDQVAGWVECVVKAIEDAG